MDDLSIVSGGRGPGNLTVAGKATIGENLINTGTGAFIVGRNSVATGNFSTISGGENHTVDSGWSTVGGGVTQ